MAYHGSGRASLENAVARAQRREVKAKEIAAWFNKRKKRIRNPEAYAQAIEDNKRLGLTIQPKSAKIEDRVLRMHKVSRRAVSLPGVDNTPPRSERELAEEEMIAAVKQAVELLTFHLLRLSQVPNPNSTFQNQVLEKQLIESVRRLCYVVKPPLPDPLLGADRSQPRVRAEFHACVNCGGPGREERAGEWYCLECAA